MKGQCAEIEATQRKKEKREKLNSLKTIAKTANKRFKYVPVS